MTGAIGLLRLLRQGHPCRLILPQDSVFTGAFCAVIGKIAGVRVVGVEHGTVTFPYSSVYQKERVGELKHSPWSAQLLGRLQLALYWPSLRMLARLSVHLTDHFLIAGDESAQIYLEQLGIPSHRITRWRFTIDVDRYAPPDADACARQRSQKGLTMDAVVVALAARMSPAKGLDIALQGIRLALSRLPVDLARRVRVIIAGDGPLRPRVEADLRRHQLEEQCELWGETSSEDVIRLLGMSDIFLYTSTRGTNFSMAVLEAMASSCAVIASNEPISNLELLSEGRGLAIPAGDAEAVSRALVEAVSDVPRCREMGRAARLYVAEHHGAEALRRSLLRATYWSQDLTRSPTLANQHFPADQ